MSNVNSVYSIPMPVYTEETVPAPEYRVRTVVRYVVTRYCHPYVSRDGKTGSSGHSELLGEFHNEQRAYETAQALAAREPGNATVSV